MREGLLLPAGSMWSQSQQQQQQDRLSPGLTGYPVRDAIP